MIIDTDVGPDDLMAIAFLLSRPDVNVQTITIVNGLASVDVGADNVLRLLALAGATQVPVYLGASSHLQPTRAFPPSYRESSEKTGAAAAPATRLKPRTLSAIDFLADVFRGARPSTEILALGPLTNLAHAIRKAGAHVQPLRTVIMGGGFDVPGNLPSPEFRPEPARYLASISQRSHRFGVESLRASPWSASSASCERSIKTWIL